MEPTKKEMEKGIDVQALVDILNGEHPEKKKAAYESVFSEW